MTRGRLKSLGHDPDKGQRPATIPYDADLVKQIVDSGRLV